MHTRLVSCQRLRAMRIGFHAPFAG
jgi:hypothetical protein